MSTPDYTQRVMQPYMIGAFLGVNAVRDAYLLVEGPDCIHMKTQYVQGNHDWLSTLTSVSGYHRVANTALHPVEMTASRESELRDFLVKMAEREDVAGVLFTSMPMAFITGADYERLCREVTELTGTPVVPIPGKSLSGDWLDGYEESLNAMARYLPLEGGELAPERVAVIGNLFDRNEGDHRANVAHLRALLEGLGLEAVSIWLEGGTFADLLAAGRAGTVVSLPYGRRAAKRVARRTGARLVECELPFGLPATERFVRAVAEATGRMDRAEQVIDAELARVVPAMEWVVPFLFQHRSWGYIGDPHLLPGLRESAEVVGARLSFAVVTNHPRHARGLETLLGEDVPLLVYPRQKEMSAFLEEHLGRGSVDLLVANSEGTAGGTDVAAVELGFPSIYHHCLYDRPYLGFQGFLAFMDSAVNAMRRQEVLATQRRHQRHTQKRSDERADADRERSSG